MPLSEILIIFRWWALIFLIGVSFLPWTIRFFSSFIDRGYIFSKVIGILVLSYTVFVFSYLHILKFSQLNSLAVLIILAIANFVIWQKNKFSIKKDLKIFFFEEFIFLTCLFAWSWVRSFQPDVHDLEKFMDFGFINSILRTDYFPPKDMWFTPFSINYYYFGHLFTAVLTKITDIPSYISFNLMLASIFAFTFSGSFSIGTNLISKIKKYSLKRSAIFALGLSYIVALGGNLQTVYSLFKGYSADNPLPFWKLHLSITSFPNGYWYPNATRFIYHTIHEFPSYSFVVADLHGHVLDIPVVLTLIALALVIFLEKKSNISILVLSSFLIAVSYMTNAWDGLIYLMLFTILLFIKIYNSDTNKNLWKKISKSLINSFKNFLVLFIGFILFTLLFNLSFSPFANGIGLNCSPKFLINLGKLGPFLFENGQCQHSPWWQLLILYGFPLYMIGSFIIFMRRRKPIVSDLFVLSISFFSIFLIIVPEFFYLRDIYTTYFRANTMFKLSYQAFIMFGISSIYILIRVISSIRENKNPTSIVVKIIFLLVSLLLMFFVVIYPYFAVPSGYGDLKKIKGLNGQIYLKNLHPGDYEAINWINKDLKGQPVILEAQGDSYTDYARISANTGLPTVLGWTVHEWLWRGTYDIPAARLDDISNLYETSDLSEAKRIIKKYNISYIYIGELELAKYKVSENKFKTLGKMIYSKYNTRIYKLAKE